MANENKIPIKLKVKTTIYQDGDRQTTELITFGTLVKKETADFIQYDEVMEEVGTIATTLKLAQDEALILRNGPVKMNLPLQKNKKRFGRYTTPYGIFDLVTQTSRYTYVPNENSGIIELLYDLEIQDQPAGQFSLNIEFKEDKINE